MPHSNKKFKLENIESWVEFIEENSIESFTDLFYNETLSRVYRLIISHSELKADNKFLNNVKLATDKESEKRNFDCYTPKNNKNWNHENVFDVVYCNKKIIYI